MKRFIIGTAEGSLIVEPRRALQRLTKSDFAASSLLQCVQHRFDGSGPSTLPRDFSNFSLGLIKKSL